MKSTRNLLIGMFFSGGLVIGLHFLHAQIAVVGGFNGDIAPIQSATPDSIVQIAADEQGLQLVSPDQVPRFATFWWVLPGSLAVPAPFLPKDSFGSIYQIADGQFLVDDTGGQVILTSRPTGRWSMRLTGVAALAAQADGLVNLITQVQTAQLNQQMQAMGIPLPSDGGDGGTNNYSPDYNNITPPDYGTNLWLRIVSVANGVVSLSMSNTIYTQTGEVYEVMSKTDLTVTNWNIATEVWAVSNQNWIAFTVPMSSLTNLFIWARDWTGVTENGNTTPDWWFWEYFGTLDLSDTNLDANGNTLLYDYTNGLSPPSFYIVTAPLSQGVYDGDMVTFSVVTGGNTNLTYQWTSNSIAIAGATNSNYTISCVQDSDAGNNAVVVRSKGDKPVRSKGE